MTHTPNKSQFPFKRISMLGLYSLALAMVVSPLHGQQAGSGGAGANRASNFPSAGAGRSSQLQPVQQQQGNDFRNRPQVQEQFGQDRFARELTQRQQQQRQVLSDDRSKSPNQTQLQSMPNSELSNLKDQIGQMRDKDGERRNELLKNFRTPDPRLTGGNQQALMQNSGPQVAPGQKGGYGGASGMQNGNQGFGPGGAGAPGNNQFDRFKQEIRQDEARRVSLVNEVKYLIQTNQIKPGEIKIEGREDFHKQRQQGQVPQGVQQFAQKGNLPEGLHNPTQGGRPQNYGAGNSFQQAKQRPPQFTSGGVNNPLNRPQQPGQQPTRPINQQSPTGIRPPTTTNPLNTGGQLPPPPSGTNTGGQLPPPPSGTTTGGTLPPK